jgi:hypothetical protein
MIIIMWANRIISLRKSVSETKTSYILYLTAIVEGYDIRQYNVYSSCFKCVVITTVTWTV